MKVFEMTPVKDFIPHFGDGICFELPNGTDFRFSEFCETAREYGAEITPYCVHYEENNEWHHCVRLVFDKKRFPRFVSVEPVMNKICHRYGIKVYTVIDGGSAVKLDADGDPISMML